MQDRDGTVALTDDITGGTRAGSFTTLATSGNITANNASATGSVGTYLSTAGVVRAGFSIDHNATVSYLDIDGSLFVRSVPSYAAVFSINSAGIGAIPGGLQVTGVALLGYGIGAGGTATQATSKSTAVALNKPSGLITMNNAALAAGATAAFQVSNSLVAVSDSVVVSLAGGYSSGVNYNVWVNVNTGTPGEFYVVLKNISAGSLSEAVRIKFEVIKGATS